MVKKMGLLQRKIMEKVIEFFELRKEYKNNKIKMSKNYDKRINTFFELLFSGKILINYKHVKCECVECNHHKIVDQYLSSAKELKLAAN